MPSWEAEVTERRFNVLFLCSGNSARSIMAEAIMNRDGAAHFRAFSAGNRPKAEADPLALALLRKLNFKTEGLRPKDWSTFAAPESPKMDFVFTVCDRLAGEACPVWPGQPLAAHWGVPDPAAADQEESETDRHLAYADVFRMLNNRIQIFMSLPISSIDRLALQERLQRIGGAAVPEPPS